VSRRVVIVAVVAVVYCLIGRGSDAKDIAVAQLLNAETRFVLERRLMVRHCFLAPDPVATAVVAVCSAVRCVSVVCVLLRAGA
jgi:hypothetical protein